jgi:hypothetical protein
VASAIKQVLNMSAKGVNIGILKYNVDTEKMLSVRLAGVE